MHGGPRENVCFESHRNRVHRQHQISKNTSSQADSRSTVSLLSLTTPRDIVTYVLGNSLDKTAAPRWVWKKNKCRKSSYK
jgi:hypothetical protein